MGYEMYRQLTYTIDDNPYERDKPASSKRKVLSLTEQANIEKYRKYIVIPV
jgi:hypothetical protein